MIHYSLFAALLTFAVCNAAQQTKTSVYSPRMTNTVKILVQKRKALEVAFLNSLCEPKLDDAQKILNTGAVAVNLRRDEHHWVNDAATPLMIVAMGGFYRNTLELLLNNGADVFIENQGKNIYHYANIDIHTHCLTYFMKYMFTTGKALFHTALASHANIEIKDLADIIFAYAYTPSQEILNQALLRAALWSKSNQVHYLLSQGADSNTQDEKNETPLIKVVSLGLVGGIANDETILVVKELLKYRADPTMADAEGKSAEDYANNTLGTDHTLKNQILKLFEEHKKSLQENKEEVS